MDGEKDQFYFDLMEFINQRECRMSDVQKEFRSEGKKTPETKKG